MRRGPPNGWSFATRGRSRTRSRCCGAGYRGGDRLGGEHRKRHVDRKVGAQVEVRFVGKGRHGLRRGDVVQGLSEGAEIIRAVRPIGDQGLAEYDLDGRVKPRYDLRRSRHGRPDELVGQKLVKDGANRENGRSRIARLPVFLFRRETRAIALQVGAMLATSGPICT